MFKNNNNIKKVTNLKPLSESNKSKIYFLFSFSIILILILYAFSLQPANAQSNTTFRCIDNSTQQTNTSVLLQLLNSTGSIVNQSSVVTSDTITCNSGCSSLTNTCRLDLSTQLLEVVGITGAFFALLFLATILSENIRFVDSIISLVLGIISAVFGITDLFSTSIGYIFFGEAIIFIVATILLAYRDLYG